MSTSSKDELNPPTNTPTSDVDMSEAAIEARLDEVRSLYELGISLTSIDLSKAKPVAKRFIPQ
jgi:hypothetical protein